jgi:TolB-like protein/DNA-binding winged helix-turn-helix (wHTH) protein
VAACSLTVLGGFGLRSPDGRDLALSTRKDRLLLAYLALNAGRPLARDRLAGLLWGDRGETQARDSLRQSLAAIRQAFRQVALDPIASERDSVTFNSTGIEIDAIVFERTAAEAGTRLEAAALYRGALLDSIDGQTSEFEAWLGPERERLASIAVRLVEQIADSAAPSELATCLARQLLARDPLCEPAYRALMRLHAASGERAAALKLYTTCREVLKKELNATPDLQTETLYRDILTERPAQNSASEAAKPADRPSIAVLPFSNLSRDPDLDHLCEGLAEDIITGLGRFRLLFVIDRYSSSMIAKQESDIAEIGKRLGVAHLVQGSLQRQGERVRITVRLLDAMTRAQLWGEAYDYAFADLANIPDTITGALVSTLHGQVERALVDHGRHKPKLAAYDCVLRGIKHLRGYAPGDNERAIELFQQAVEIDPDYALARAYRGFADIVAHNYNFAPAEIRLSALKMASAAVEMDPQNGRCHWLLGIVHLYCGNFEESERHHQRALTLNPNDANALVSSAAILAWHGRYEEGFARMRDAMRLNPYHPEWYWITLGNSFYSAHRYEDALEAYKHRTDPGYWFTARIAACYGQLGRMEEARAAAAQVIRLKPDFTISKERGAWWSDGRDLENIRDGLRKAGLPE